MLKHKKRFVLIFTFILAFAPLYSIAFGANFPVQPVPTPPTQGLPTNLGQLIQQIFTWSLGILGISVFVMFFYSGFLWLTAAGNTSKIGEAKTHMTNAVFGAILLLSSYLILNTINPDFVRNTVNLPGLGKTSTYNPPAEQGPPPPSDASTKHSNHLAEIATAKDELLAEGRQFPDPNATDECFRFEIVERAVSKIGNGAGFLDKSGGNNCKGFAVDIIAFSDGYIYDVLSGEEDGSVPAWNPSACGPVGGNGTCPDRYRTP